MSTYKLAAVCTSQSFDSFSIANATFDCREEAFIQFKFLGYRLGYNGVMALLHTGK